MVIKIDVYKKYFVMSFRYNKNKPEDFGLTLSNEENTYINKEDSSLWQKRNMYDFGWGSEYGFMRLPILSFEEAWYLLMNTHIEENKYGVASLIESEYAEELLSFLLGEFRTKQIQTLTSMKPALEILQLKVVRNRSKTIGKTYDQVNQDFENWKYISEKVNQILKLRPEG